MTSDGRISADDAVESIKRAESNQPPATLFVAMVSDRHSGEVTPHLFTNAQAAIDYARTCANAYAREPGDVMQAVNPGDGRLYDVTWSSDRLDRAYVIETPIDNPTDPR